MQENRKEKKKSKIYNFIEEWFSLIFILLGLAVLLITVKGYLDMFGENLIPTMYDQSEIARVNKESIERFGQFGDFIGGTLNPTFAFLSFMAILWTLKIQIKALNTSQKELELSREELAKSSTALTEQSKSLKIQNFETTFFNMINLHNEIVKNINFQTNLEFKFTSEEKSIYNYKKTRLSFSITSKEIKNGREAIQIIGEKIDNFYLSTYSRIFSNIYDLCHENLQLYIGHYFGNIYQILKFISLNKDINDKEKRKYSNLFRAQFSSIELKLLFYHCTGKIGSTKFKNYIEEFKFFEHLVIEPNNKIFQSILSSNIYKSVAFGENIEIIKFINIEKEENEKWLEEYLSKDTKEKEDLYLEAVKRFTYKEDYISAIREFKQYYKSDFTNFFETFIEYLEEQLEKSNTSSQEQQ